MRRFCFMIFVLIAFGFTGLSQGIFQLAPPVFSYGSVFFRDQTNLSIFFAMKGSSIRYTTNGQEPSLQDPVYSESIRISEKITTVTARTFAEGYHPSDPAKVTFIKEGHPIRSVTTIPAAHEKYTGGGPATLHDGNGGNASQFDNWWGFDSDTVQMRVLLSAPVAIQQVLIHFLENQGSWIFLPRIITVTVKDKRSNSYKKIAESPLDALHPVTHSHCVPIVVAPESQLVTDEIFLTFQLVKSLPEWHTGKGQHAWMFIDEIEIF